MVDSDSGDSLALLEAEKLPLRPVQPSQPEGPEPTINSTCDSDESDTEALAPTSKSRRNQILPGGSVGCKLKSLQMATVMSQTDICGEDFHHQMVDSPNMRQMADSRSDPPRICEDTKGDRESMASSGNLSAADFCRICHCADPPLISPCFCAGTSRWVHQRCLQMWIKSSQTRSCEVCRYSFVMETKLKPFTKWEKLDMSSVERRKVLCSVTFHIIAITCVVWSLYVLIDRTADEIRQSQLEWPFWTKLVVVAIGFTGGLVFMYVQCKMYAGLFRRWKAYNKVIYVQNCPDSVNTSARHQRRLQQPEISLEFG